MKFLIDAQLPRQLCTLLDGAGHDSIHTSALPESNRTGDRQITETADREDRVVITKDRDFRDSHLLRGLPRRLLIVATGNIANDHLLDLFEHNIALIIEAFESAFLVEINQTNVVIHDDR